MNRVGFTDVVYPDLQSLDLSQVSFLSVFQPPPLRILLLDKLHLSGETRGRGDRNVVSRCERTRFTVRDKRLDT